MVIILGSLVALPFVPRFGQDPEYHDFADQRTMLGVPHFWNVVSNLLFVVVGASGLLTLRRTRAGPDSGLYDPRERMAWSALFIGCLLTGLGSAWYHLDPDNGSLVWDRLPLGVASVSVGLIILQERVSLTWTRRLLWPTIGAALLSVPWWYLTERHGHGDLRLYAWCLALPCVIVMVGGFLPGRYTGGRAAWGALAFYAGARLTEVLDREVMGLPLLWSGHTWKHVLAAGTVWVFAHWLKTRRPLPGVPPPAPAAPGGSWTSRALMLLIIGITVYTVASFLAAELLLHPRRILPGDAPGTRTVTVSTSDGIDLVAWVKEPMPAKGTVVVLHGIGSSRSAGRLQTLAAAGFRVVAPDFRAHGESGGGHTTFGLHEGRDVDAVVAWTRARWPNEPVAAYGTSLGAAALCCADSTPTLDAVILESVYSSLQAAYENRLRMRLPEWLLWLGAGPRLMVELRTGISADELDLVRRVPRLDGSRVMLATGSQDRRATVGDLRRLQEALPGCRPLIVDGATHEDVWSVGAVPYRDALTSFLRERLR